MAGAVSGAFGGAAGFLLGSTAAGFGLLMMAHGASSMGEASIENAILGEKITVPMLLTNAAIGAVTFGFGDNIARAASKTWNKLVGEGAEKVAKEALEEGAEQAGKKAGTKTPPSGKKPDAKTPPAGKNPGKGGGKGAPSGKNGAGGKPKSGAGNKAGATGGKDANYAVDHTKVGRWMSQSEYDKMIETGKVQMSADNKVHVANPANIDAFIKQAPKGSIYVEFEVPSNTISPGGADGWGIINGPGSLLDRLNKQKGLPQITEMPTATNIKIEGGK